MRGLFFLGVGLGGVSLLAYGLGLLQPASSVSPIDRKQVVMQLLQGLLQSQRATPVPEGAAPDPLEGDPIAPRPGDDAMDALELLSGADGAGGPSAASRASIEAPEGLEGEAARLRHEGAQELYQAERLEQHLRRMPVDVSTYRARLIRRAQELRRTGASKLERAARLESTALEPEKAPPPPASLDDTELEQMRQRNGLP
jgi:hypothetical protein